VRYAICTHCLTCRCNIEMHLFFEIGDKDLEYLFSTKDVNAFFSYLGKFDIIIFNVINVIKYSLKQ
jgi:hypothetical protein